MTEVTYGPLSTWPGPRTPASARRRSPFSAAWSTTTIELDRELHYLAARRAVIELDLEDRWFRLDGLPRANAPQPADPGVVLSLPDTKHGPLRYSCDAFTRWQDNFRAIVLGLESLRRVERYGIAKRGEQYAGWKQISAATLTRDQARDRLARVLRADPAYRDDRIDVLADTALARKALTRSHPDAGGDPDVFRDEILPAYTTLTGERA
jgi:hypothetical protein